MGLSITGKKLFNFLYRSRLLAGTVYIFSRYENILRIVKFKNHCSLTNSLKYRRSCLWGNSPVASFLWGKSTMGWIVHGIHCPWDGLSVGWIVHEMDCPWDELSMGWTVHVMDCPWRKFCIGRGVKCTLYTIHEVSPPPISLILLQRK